MMDQIKIGKFIAQRRHAQKMTQSELGALLGVSAKAVSKWERGISLPDASLYEHLCLTLDITLDDLFKGEILNDQTKKSKKRVPFLIALIPLALALIFFLYPQDRFEELNMIKLDLVYSAKQSDDINYVSLVLEHAPYDLGEGEYRIDALFDDELKEILGVDGSFIITLKNKQETNQYLTLLSFGADSFDEDDLIGETFKIQLRLYQDERIIGRKEVLVKTSVV